MDTTFKLNLPNGEGEAMSAITYSSEFAPSGFYARMLDRSTGKFFSATVYRYAFHNRDAEVVSRSFSADSGDTDTFAKNVNFWNVVMRTLVINTWVQPKGKNAQVAEIVCDDADDSEVDPDGDEYGFNLDR